MPVPPDRARAVAAARFRALGDETRLRLLEQLSAGERNVGELMEAMGLGQSLVSHHLRALREVGLVRDRRDGRWVYYSIAEQALTSTRLTIYELEPLRSAAAREAAATE
ncbi:MAG TPA: metalloregulator ArsR/SmtB family transcription factor [Gemmatimonadaceae bacterium]|nr:metalloregulator ArsR/SmtB family transcription factor [Gemmatimonadaceae bacterium]